MCYRFGRVCEALHPLRQVLAFVRVHDPSLWTVSDQVAEGAGYVNNRIDSRVPSLREDTVRPPTVMKFLLTCD